jgi:hypothetical protein
MMLTTFSIFGLKIAVIWRHVLLRLTISFAQVLWNGRSLSRLEAGFSSLAISSNSISRTTQGISAKDNDLRPGGGVFPVEVIVVLIDMIEYISSTMDDVN